MYDIGKSAEENCGSNIMKYPVIILIFLFNLSHNSFFSLYFFSRGFMEFDDKRGEHSAK